MKDYKKLSLIYEHKILQESPVEAPVETPTKTPTISPPAPAKPTRPNPHKNPFGPQPGKREETKPKASSKQQVARKLLRMLAGLAK